MTSPQAQPQIAILGAGPVGLEAARRAIELGRNVSVYEQGQVGEYVRRWQSVRLFSPLQMNATTTGLEIAGIHSDRHDECLTGQEFLDTYLRPLADWVGQRSRLLTNTKVLAVSRGDLLKGEAIGKRAESKQMFRLLLNDQQGERIETADLVLDCTGVYGQPNSVGTGGIPCPGEHECRDFIDYGLPDLLQNSEQYLGKKLLIVGSGYSAATVVSSLSQTIRKNVQTQVIWSTRSSLSTGPIAVLEEDALPQRHSLTQHVNQLALHPDSTVDWRPETVVEKMERIHNQSQLQVTLRQRTSDVSEVVTVDRMIACTGFRPDAELTRELQIHECYATSGPIKLAASLLGQASGDCLNQLTPGPETLINPESGYYILGAKSYGRNSQFLMRIGYKQVAQVLEN